MATLSLRYPGCKSLFIRGLRFRSSLLVAQAFGRGFVDLCSTPRHPAALEGKKILVSGVNVQQVQCLKSKSNWKQHLKSCIIYYNCLLFSLTKNKTVLSLCSRVTSLLPGQSSWSQPLNTHYLKTIDAFIDIGAGLREVGSTLGARDFSNAVSRFCQVFIVTRANSFSRGFGQHRKFPPHARKTSGTQGKGLRLYPTYIGPKQSHTGSTVSPPVRKYLPLTQAIDLFLLESNPTWFATCFDCKDFWSFDENNYNFLQKFFRATCVSILAKNRATRGRQLSPR